MAKLLLVRHGDTALNSRERFWGHTDVKLSEAGMCQAHRLRDRLTSEKINAIYASDLQRSLVTAQIIASEHHLEVCACPEIQETNFGQIEGMTFEEMKMRFPDLTNQWLNWSLQIQFPGGENVAQVDKRVGQFMERIKRHTEDETILVVAHAGVLRMLICRLLEIDLQHWRQLRLSLASLSIVETHPGGSLLMLLNDVCHLEGCA